MWYFRFFLQLFVAWIVDRTEYVSPESVAVMLVMLEIYAINCLVTNAVPNMVNVKTALVSARKDGMGVIALCVSIH